MEVAVTVDLELRRRPGRARRIMEDQGRQALRAVELYRSPRQRGHVLLSESAADKGKQQPGNQESSHRIPLFSRQNVVHGIAGAAELRASTPVARRPKDRHGPDRSLAI